VLRIYFALLFYSVVTLLTLLQFFKVLNITSDQKKFFRKAFHTYYDAAAELLQSEHSVRLLILLKLLHFFGLVRS
jgi:hypothetical protein